MDRPRALVLLAAVLLLAVSSPLPGQDEPDDGAIGRPQAAQPDEKVVGRESLVQLLKAANPMVWPLALCSIVTLGFALERAVALRRSRVVPCDFVERFLDRLEGGKLDRDRANELCRAHDSPVARVFGVIVSHWGQPAAAIRQAVAHDAAAEVIDLRRNVRALNGTATLAPLLGLLGTVFGMIEAFEAIGGPAAGGLSKGERLAHGISLALMATAAGLVIAIVSVAAYYYLLHRVDVLVRELDEQARKVIDLVAGDPLAMPRPAMDRRHLGAGDPLRNDPRTLGRSELL